MRRFFYQTGLFCLTGLALAGCQMTRGGSTEPGALALPSGKNVKILSRDIALLAGAAPGSLHHKWTVLGERNWTTPRIINLAGALEETYPLNDTQRKGGCNTWEYDLTAARLPASPSVVHWVVTLHGSNGATARSEGDTALAGGAPSLDAVVQIVEARDTVRQLPADLTLARIGDAPLTLHIVS